MSVQPTDSVEIGTSRAITIAIDLSDAGGTQDGINLCVNGGDDYTVTPQGARRIAQALADAADEVERLAEEASVLG